MPYAKKADLPEAVKELPEHGQEIWMAAFNSAWEQYKDEEKAFATAWAAVKNKYKKEEGQWVALSEPKAMEWIEIFKVGRHTDSQGRTRDWTENDLEEIARSYNPAEHEAPVVVGHPLTDSPAYGWVESLKAEGGRLLAKLKDLAPEFVDWVRRGLYKKISIALYPDLTLKHIGFLGATPPAVKGLKQAVFGDRKAAWEVEMEFNDKCSHIQEDGEFIGGFDGCVEHMMQCEGLPEENARRLCAYIGRRAGKIPGGHAEPKESKGGNRMREWLNKMKEAIGLAEKELTPDPELKYSEADIKEAEEKAKRAAFAEAEKKLEQEKKEKEEAKKKLAEMEKKARQEAVHSFCESLMKEGKAVPAWQKMGIEEFMLSLDDSGPYKFAEGQEKSQAQWFRDFLSELPKAVTFKEVAPSDKAGPNSGGSAAERLAALVKKKMEEFKHFSYSQAFSEVQKENPELVAQYRLEIGKEEK